MQHSATPFDHWVLDDFLPPELAEAAHAQFFNGTGPWVRRHHLYSRRKATRTEGLPPGVEAALRHLESPILCATMEVLTKVRPLVRRASSGPGGGSACSTWPCPSPRRPAISSRSTA